MTSVGVHVPEDAEWSVQRFTKHSTHEPFVTVEADSQTAGRTTLYLTVQAAHELRKALNAQDLGMQRIAIPLGAEWEIRLLKDDQGNIIRGHISAHSPVHETTTLTLSGAQIVDLYQAIYSVLPVSVIS